MEVNVKDAKAHTYYYVTVRKYIDGSWHCIDTLGNFFGAKGEWLATEVHECRELSHPLAEWSVIVKVVMSLSGKWFAFVKVLDEDDDTTWLC